MSQKSLTLGERLELALKTLAISQSQASLRTGVPQGTISHLIRNQARTYKNSRAIADGLKINHDWLVYGRGGILNPAVFYIPVIHEYFRLRLYQSESFLEDNTNFLVTEQDYGKGMFATILDASILICSRPAENESPVRKAGFLLWTERRKAIISDQVQGKRVFLIHEVRTYESMPIQFTPDDIVSDKETESYDIDNEDQ
ncbi:helix-turn-helix domain-containing protein [Enterobacter asburiae]